MSLLEISKAVRLFSLKSFNFFFYFSLSANYFQMRKMIKRVAANTEPINTT
jgi:hypothetical protein